METRLLPGDAPSAHFNPRRILVRGVNWLGDAVMTTPALLRLREKFPDAHIALLTPEKLKDLWQQHPAINQIITFAPADSPFSVGRKLGRLQAELGLVFPNSPRSALDVWLARIPRRIGYARPWRNWFLTQAIPSRPGHTPMRKFPMGEINRRNANPTHHASRITHHETAHQLHDYLHLAGQLGAIPEPLAPCLKVAPGEIDEVVRRFNLTTVVANNRLLLAVCPGAEYGPAKRWPIERFVAATLEIQKRTKCIWLILGGPAEVEFGGRIELALRGLYSELRNLAGQTSLRELCALLKLSRAVLTNDTGPMHVAAALGTPVVVPFGSTSPELTGPGLPGDPRHRLLRSDAPCSPCFRRECPIDLRCLTGISVERVVEAVVETLKR
jgi:heptosyltransferase II